jgi:hypothetical protein
MNMNPVYTNIYRGGAKDGKKRHMLIGMGTGGKTAGLQKNQLSTQIRLYLQATWSQ